MSVKDQINDLSIAASRCCSDSVTREDITDFECLACDAVLVCEILNELDQLRDQLADAQRQSAELRAACESDANKEAIGQLLATSSRYIKLEEERDQLKAELLTAEKMENKTLMRTGLIPICEITLEAAKDELGYRRMSLTGDEYAELQFLRGERDKLRDTE